jgi:hypothetical protein
MRQTAETSGVVWRGGLVYLQGDATKRSWRRMGQLAVDYLPIIVFLGVCLFLGAAIMIAPFILAYKNPDPEKVSAYECGFNAFDDARMKFDVRFYLVRSCSSSSIWRLRSCFPGRWRSATSVCSASGP